MDYKYVIDSDGARITEYHGFDSILNIPSIIDDTSVISIEKKAFMGCKTLVEVYIPENVLAVGDLPLPSATI